MTRLFSVVITSHLCWQFSIFFICTCFYPPSLSPSVVRPFWRTFKCFLPAEIGGGGHLGPDRLSAPPLFRVSGFTLRLLRLFRRCSAAFPRHTLYRCLYLRGLGRSRHCRILSHTVLEQCFRYRLLVFSATSFFSPRLICAFSINLTYWHLIVITWFFLHGGLIYGSLVDIECLPHSPSLPVAHPCHSAGSHITERSNWRNRVFLTLRCCITPRIPLFVARGFRGREHYRSK